MMVKTLFAGFGGQGVLMMGQILAQAAMNAGYYVTYLPAYGAEVRGGTANCTVCVSDEEIASPIASELDNLLVLNAPSLSSFQNRIAAGGSLFMNSSIIEAEPSRKGIRTFKIPSSEIAEQLGNTRAANTVMLGAFMKVTGLVEPDTFLSSMAEVMGSKKQSIVEINRKAFTAGYEFLK
jgi:2-oxoglutarate ferredoxin oxidoreductase subunit gamma